MFVTLGAACLLAFQPAPPVVPPSGIANRAGQLVTVCATATDVVKRENGSLALTIVRGRQRATVVVAAPGAGDASRYQGKAICATGTAGKGTDGPWVDVASEENITDDTFAATAFRAGREISYPKPMREVKPDYPREALQAGIEGTVVVEAIVLPSGQVGDVRLVESLDPLLDRAALDAAKRWEFIPGLRFGQPVPVVVTLEMAFKVADRKKR